MANLSISQQLELRKLYPNNIQFASSHTFITMKVEDAIRSEHLAVNIDVISDTHVKLMFENEVFLAHFDVNAPVTFNLQANKELNEENEKLRQSWITALEERDHLEMELNRASEKVMKMQIDINSLEETNLYLKAQNQQITDVLNKIRSMFIN